MKRKRAVQFSVGVALAVAATVLLGARAGDAQSFALAPSTMPRIGAVSERYQSYNVEMVEVIGGRFWKPYAGNADVRAEGNAPVDRSSGVRVHADRDAARSRQCAPADIGGRARSCISASQRHVGEQRLFPSCP